MKQTLFILALLATSFMACKKDKNKPDIHGDLIGIWEDTRSDTRMTQNWIGEMPEDRYVFKSSGEYFRLYSGDIGEEGAYQINKGADAASITVQLSRAPHVLDITWKHKDTIRITLPDASSSIFVRIKN